MRRVVPVLLSAVVAGIGLITVAPAVASPAAVTGQLLMRERATLSPNAVAVITLVDQQPSPDAGAIIGQQRIDNVTIPVAYSVAYESDRIDPTHSYAVYASVVDGTTTYETIEPAPVITGGPTSDVSLTLVPRSPLATSAVSGVITRADKRALTADAVAIAILVNADTGTLVARDVIPSPPAEPVAFSIPFDPGLIDPAATYLAKAAIVDGSTSWEGREGVPAIEGGVPSQNLAIPVSLVAGSSPPPSSSPTAAPSEVPTEAPTPTSTATEAPTATPTEAPTPTPTETPTPTPTETSSPSETTAPSASPGESASAEPTPTATETPTTGVVRGTLTYRESHTLGPDARAVVLLADVAGQPTRASILASTTFTPTGPPAPFELSYALSDVDHGAHYALYAGIVDGDLAWLTPVGVFVDVPNPLIETVLALTYRPDLLKGSVTGTLVGDGLDPAGNASAFGAVLIVDVAAGETLGFQLLTPIGASPVDFSVPWDARSAKRDADYVVRAWVWDGAAWWASFEDPRVITNGNPTSGVMLQLNRSITPPPTPTTPEPSRGPGLGLLLLVLLLIGAGAIVTLGLARTRH